MDKRIKIFRAMKGENPNGGNNYNQGEL